jgi:NADP-dependent 3-hydroxy acid dehydrogenase YdfG
MDKEENKKFWAVILGASSGFGGATAMKLADDGYNIIGIHLDRQATMPNVELIILNQTEEKPGSIILMLQISLKELKLSLNLNQN